MIDKRQRGWHQPSWVAFVSQHRRTVQMSSGPSAGQTLSGPGIRAQSFLEYGQHDPDRESSEKAALMGHSCTPHLHLDLTGRARALFKVTTDATFVLLSKDCPLSTMGTQQMCLLHRRMRTFVFVSPIIFSKLLFFISCKMTQRSRQCVWPKVLSEKDERRRWNKHRLV